jgi:hypothetical protein
MRKFVLIFAALTGEASIEADERQKGRIDFPVVVTATSKDEAETIASQIAALSNCRAVEVRPLPERDESRRRTPRVG